MHVNRREFLRKSICAALGGASLYSALGSLKLIGAAAAAQRPSGFTDYKALVCVFMYGGNDSFNTIVPMSGTDLTSYLASRGDLAITAGQHALAPASGGGPANYGLHPSMPEMASLFNTGKAAIVANVGSLLYPITQAQFQDETVPTPPQLFSHDDQTNQWQTSRPDDANANGWGGRIADILHATNQGAVPMSITLSGMNRFQRGGIVSQYSIDSWGASCAATGNPDCGPFSVTTMDYLGNGPESWLINWDDPNVVANDVAAYNALIASGTQTHVLERAYADAATRTIANSTLINNALNGVTLTTAFPDTDLGNQLAAVAMLIKVRAALGMARQIYFVSVGNYDTHGTQLTDQGDNLIQLSQGMSAFYNATVELGIANSVTAFTASDFGRSLAVNGDGTDHGWGGHHFVVGGAVHGQRFYGTMPSLAPYDDNNPGGSNPDDTGYGQIIPTQAVDQYAATLATWFGVDASSVNDIFPNLGRFPSSDLGFMT
ncbi:MAG TPA: DUF1501 domain-containing protein [Rhodanobacteraceae bacterium]|nr:DUF1501 domain-containing protein [Rhodanobacteraceae bacterium]